VNAVAAIDFNGIGSNGSMPYSEDCEKGLLGSILKSPIEVLEKCHDQLSADTFYIPAHKIIYNLVIEFSDKSKPTDFVSVKQALKDRNQLEEIGGPEFLSSLYSFVPTAANAAYYIEIVREKYLLRRLILAFNRLSKRCYDPQEEIEPLLAEAQREFTDLTEEGPTRNGLPKFENFSEVSETDLVEPATLIDGILHLGSKLTLGGASKSYKTWTLIDLALSVASGGTCLDRKCEQGRVLYVNLEIQPAFFWKRVQTVADSKRLPEGGEWRRNLVGWNLRGHCIDAEKLCSEILRRFRDDGGFHLIVIDPLYKIGGNREENSNDQAATLLNLLESLARETGAAIAYGQHFSKGNQATKESIDRVSGAGVFARDPDSILMFTKHATDGAYTVEATLRNFAPFEPFVVRWEYPRFVRDNTLDPAELKQPKKGGRSASYSANDLLECLGNQDLTAKEFETRVREQTGMSHGKFFELFGEAKQAGLIHKCKIDGKWEAVRK
jgi:hypothetical protein